jgi:guanine deaminase
MITLQGTLLNPVARDECTITPDGVVRFGDDGRIAAVETSAASKGDVVGGEGCWILPGFIDAHLHLPQWDRRGIDGLTLFDWHDQIVYPAEARFRDQAVAQRLADEFVTGMIQQGTTTVAAFGSPFHDSVDASFGVLARRGLRAIYGMMLNDWHCADELRQETDKALDEARDLAARWHNAENGRLSYAFCPRMPICCTEKLMRGAAALAEMLDCYIQTHMAESLAEVAAVRDAFPDQMDDVDVVADMGLLTSRTLLGHGVFLNEAQRRQVAEAGTAIVHCPTANLFLESGLMDYVAHRHSGVRVALGSSIAGGHDPFMPRVAVACLQTAKTLKVHAIPRGSHSVPKAAEAWWLITQGGAEAIGMGDRLGSLQVGYHADVLVVRPEPWIAQLPPEQQASALLYTISPDQIEHVYVDGKRIGPEE